ncbi:hypothetical protein TNCT_213892 [Trichonephila clavata]|uniref:Alpha-latrotoxin n=2 Tax=Trichonephila clavata TaxID=2740835 RepID=A0A8X6LWB1_TRICU|nr:hypothetical protein TNCT_213892 [Trichonephila clavata]
MVEVLIKNGAEIDAESDSKPTSLCLAVRNNNKEIVKILLKYGADINAKKSLPLSTAIVFGLNSIAEILLDNEKIDIHYCGIDGNSLLHIAAKQGNYFLVEAFLSRGADANAITLTDGTSPLHYAADAGYVEIVKILLKNKAKINAFTNVGLTPIHLAAVKGHTSVVKLLLENGANAKVTDNKNRNSFEMAVANGNAEVVKILLQEKNFHINDKGNDGFSLLHIAAQEGNLNIIKYLIDRGADVNSQNDAGSKPIHIAAREGHKDIVELFLNCKSLNNYLGAFDQSLVHYATMGSQLEILKLLIDLKFDVNASDRNDLKPVHIAVSSNDKNILLILLQHGAYYDAVYDGLTPLQLALYHNHVSCVQRLILIKELFDAVKHNFSEVENCIRKGVILNVKNSENITPLHYVCWKGYEGIVNLLLENKADPNVIGKGGSTPLHYAAKFNHFAIVKQLLLNGGIYNAECNNHRNPVDFTSNNDIKKLLQLLEECFRKVIKGDIKIIAKMQKITDIQIIRCIMNARDKKNQTLIIAGIHSDFPKIEQLKNFCQDGMSFYIEKADDLCSKEKYTDALPLLEKVLERRKELFGEENPVTLDIQQRLSEVLYKLQHYQKALQTFEFVFLKRKELMGANHSDTLKTREIIGLVLHRLGKNEEAISIFREILPKQQEILGPNHSAVLQIQSDMALALNAIGQHEEALALNYKVLKAHKKFLPLNHPFILVTKNNIALVLMSQKKLNEALHVFKEVYEDRKKVLGANHSDTLRTYHNMALILAQLKTDDHSKEYEEVLSLQKNALGMRHLDTLNTQINMANALFSQGNFNRAKKLFVECLDAAATILGKNHPTINHINKMLEMIQLKEAFEKGENISNFQKDMTNDSSASINMLNAMFHKLPDKNFNMNYVDEEGRTLLHYASSEGSKFMVKTLLEKGINVMLISNKGNTALHIAASKGHIEIVELLLKHLKENDVSKLNDFINAKTSGGGTTAMHVAANMGIMTSLMKHGAIYNIKNKKGETPLDLSKDKIISSFLILTHELFNASESDGEIIVQKLSKLTRDETVAIANVQNVQGNTLLQNATLNQPPGIVKNLRKFLLEKKIIL